MDTQTQIERLIELAIVQRTELKELVAQLPQLREHLSTEIEKAFDEAEPQLRAELEEWTTKQAADKTAALGVTLEAKIADLAKSLEVSTQARYNAIIAEREENARLAAQAEAKIAEHAASLPSAVKDIVTAELARFPRAGEIDQLRKEFAEPRGLNPRGKWQAGETYNKLDLVTINGDSYTSNTDGNRTRPSRSSADWTLVAARGTGGGGGPTSLSELTTVPSDGDLLIGSGTSWVTSNLTAGAGISITVGPGAITISATDGDITLDDGTAASPSLHFTNDPDTGIYRPAANTLGISTSGVQRMYVDENGITTVGAGGTFDGSVHAANGNANNPSFSFSGDQDTGFFRHQPNEIGIALGGTQYATLTSTTFSITPVVTMASSLRVNGTTDSSSKDTGAIVTEGGLGVEKSATIGGNLTVSGTGTSSIGGNTKIGNPANANQRLVVDGAVAGVGVITTNTGLSGGYLYSDGATGGVVAAWNGGNYSALSILGSTVTIGTGASGTTAATISSTGNLGIGTTSPLGVLDVRSTTPDVLFNGKDTADPVLYFGRYQYDNVSKSGAAIKYVHGSAGGSQEYGRLAFLTATGSFGALTERMRINESGNFLIGTTTDGGQKLQVSGNGLMTTGLTLGTSVVGGTGLLTLVRNSVISWNANSSTQDQYIYANGSSSLIFGTANTTALTLDSSQNATFAGGIIGMTQGNVDNISDDGVASFTPLYNRGFIVINNPDYSQNALIAYFKAGSSYLLYSITKSADVTLNNSTTLTGTTGTDGKLNIGYNNSIIYIENRLGGIANFQRYALGGTN